MNVVQTGVFYRATKKLHKTDKAAVDDAIKKIISDTGIGAMKKGVLAGVRVYKFKATDKQYLLAYRYEKSAGRITLLALGSHENSYRDLSKYR